MSEAKQIPHPPRYPFIGNVPQIFGDSFVQNLLKLNERYGPFFEIVIPNSRFFVATNFKVANEICDERRFQKKIGGILTQLRRIGGDGLFTAHNHEKIWQKAHDILIQGFSMKQMRSYVPQMHSVAEQLIYHWKSNQGIPINVSEDFTRLTLETIALCGFNYKFDVFSSQRSHPFIESMLYCLKDSFQNIKKTRLHQFLDKKSPVLFQEHLNYMFSIVDDVISNRIKSHDGSQSKSDFLNLLLNGVDKATGVGLDPQNMRYQLLTFLIAGHETTSGLLSFATYYLTQHPELQALCQNEADMVLSESQVPSLKEINSLNTIEQVLKESLRLWPTAPGFIRTPFEDTVICGEYKVKKDDNILILTPALHRDREVWGENANQFDPQRFNQESEIPTFAYRPFGTGERICIGQHFAMVEAKLALAMILRNFELKAQPDYNLKIKETLTLKPDQFFITLQPRDAKQSGASQLLKAPSSKSEELSSLKSNSVNKRTPDQTEIGHSTPVAICYGSEMGSSEDFALTLGEHLEGLGFLVKVVALDTLVDNLPNTGVIVVVTSTYNGKPPQNALKFAEWMTSKNFNPQGIYFSVVGCGNSQWQTYQEFPRQVHQAFLQRGAICISPLGEADANKDYEAALERWRKKFVGDVIDVLGIKLKIDPNKHRIQRKFTVSYSSPDEIRPLYAEFQAKPFKVLQNRELQIIGGDHGSERSTRHIELLVPKGTRYTPGDHFGVFAKNRDHLVYAVAQRLRLHLDTLINIHKKNDELQTFLPLGQNISLRSLLTEYVELQDIISRENLEKIAYYTNNEHERTQILELSRESEDGSQKYQEEIISKRRSVYDVLCLFPNVVIPFDVFLEMLSPMRPRYYSISSSQLNTPEKISLTVGIVSGPSYSANGTFKGVCSHFLQSREVGDIVYGFIKEPSEHFRLPDKVETPLIMIGPGTGIAPFRGFLAHRHALIKQRDFEGKHLSHQFGDALLFFGCRSKKHDFIYQRELEEYADQKTVQLFVAFSQDQDATCRTVQEYIRQQKSLVLELISKGAHIYVCGDGVSMAPEVRRTFLSIYKEHYDCDDFVAQDWIKSLERSGRYVLDVFGQKS